MNHDVELALIEEAKMRPGLRLEELIDDVSEQLQMKRQEVAKALYLLSEEEKLRIEDPSPPNNVFSFAGPTYSVWLWIVMLLIALSTATIYIFPQSAPYIYLRYAVGSLFVVYLPGYSLIEALYPKKDDLLPIVRLVLSIGLSLVLVPLVGLILNYTPWGIRLNPIFASHSLLTVALVCTAVIRKYTYFRLGFETLTPEPGSERRVLPRSKRRAS